MITKNGAKPKMAVYRKILEKKAEEVRNSMSAQKAAQLVARLDYPRMKAISASSITKSGSFEPQQHRHETLARDFSRAAPDDRTLRRLHGMREPISSSGWKPCRGRNIACLPGRIAVRIAEGKSSTEFKKPVSDWPICAAGNR
jgi:hypothetical protein